jgi:uncharacterized OsmC-like protein
VDPEKMRRAMQLSEDIYSLVLATLNPGLTFSSEFEIEN